MKTIYTKFILSIITNISKLKMVKNLIFQEPLTISCLLKPSPWNKNLLMAISSIFKSERVSGTVCISISMLKAQTNENDFLMDEYIPLGDTRYVFVLFVISTYNITIIISL